MTRLKLSMVDIFLAVTLAIACVFWSEASSIQAPFDAYPKLVSGFLVLFAIISFVQERFTENKPESKGILKPTVLIIGVALYILCITRVGYFVSSYLYLLVMFQANKWGDDEQFLETKSLLIDTFICLFITGMIALVFKVALGLVFPESWLF